MTVVARLWWSLVEFTGLRPGLATVVVEDLPDLLDPDRVYLVGNPDLPWSAALLCPCGCRASIQLSLVPGDSPRWRAKRHLSGSVTLHPSVWRTRDCRSHFFIRRGRVVWSRSATRPIEQPNPQEYG